MPTIIYNLFQVLQVRQDCWPFAFWAPLFLLILALTYLAGRNNRLDRARWLFPMAGGMMIALFGWFNYVYLFSPIYFGPASHIQPLIADVSWYFATGKPVYHSTDSVEAYNILYGPWLFIFTGWFERVLGPSVFSAKLGGELAVIASLIMLFVLLWKRAGSVFAVTGTGIFAALFMALGPGEILGRADVFILLFVVLGCGATCLPSRAAPVVFGLMLGLSTNLKIHAAFYFLPWFWLAWQAGWRWRQGLTAAATAFLAGIFPFLIFSNVSLENYLRTLLATSSHGIDVLNFLANLEWFFLLGLPLGCVIALAWLRDATATARVLQTLHPFLLLIVAEFLIILPFASKYGAGTRHYLPLTIPLLMLAAELHAKGVRWSWGATIAAAGVQAAWLSWLVSCLGCGLANCVEDTAWLQEHTVWAQNIETDLRGIIAKYGADHVILMGVGFDNDFSQTYFRSELVFAGQPIGLEPSALMESEFAHQPCPALDQFTQKFSQDHPGKRIMWLIPKGNTPFAAVSYYAENKGYGYGEHGALFDSAFQGVFRANFPLLTSTEYYDLYSTESSSSPEGALVSGTEAKPTGGAANATVALDDLKKARGQRAITPDQEGVFLKSLAGAGATKGSIEMRMYENADAETDQYAHQMAELFTKAGFTVTGFDIRHSPPVPAPKGVFIAEGPQKKAPTFLAALQLAFTLAQIDIQTVVSNIPDDDSKLIIYVSFKP